jgi:hypothetical protein
MSMPLIAYESSFKRNLHSGDLTRYGPTSEPAIPNGHIVFFDGLKHVALSLGERDSDGRQKVLSLLDSPMGDSDGDEMDESAIYGWMQVTTIEELMDEGDFTVIEFGSPRWEDAALTGQRTPGAATRPLPAQPFEPHESIVQQQYNGQFVSNEFRRPEDEPPVSAGGRWERINRSIPGVTRRPAISLHTWTAQIDDAAAAYADREQFVQEHYPVLHKLNPTGYMLNCNQAIIAVDHILNGMTTVRVVQRHQLRRHHRGRQCRSWHPRRGLCTPRRLRSRLQRREHPLRGGVPRRPDRDSRRATAGRGLHCVPGLSPEFPAR